jgi:hypothetical protein
MASRHGEPLRDLATAEQQRDVVSLKRAGLDFREIGRRLGISKSQAHRSFYAALDRIVEPEVAALRAEQLARIELEREETLDIMGAQHVVVSNGHVVSPVIAHNDAGDPVYGDPLIDHAPPLAAIDRLVKLDDQEAKLVGMYPKTEVDLSGGVIHRIIGVPPELL